MKYIKYTLITLSLFLSACSTKAEKEAKREIDKEAQRQNALDISGKYKPTEDSEMRLTFTITNQNGNHDIFIPMIRRWNPFVDKEKTFFNELAEEHGRYSRKDGMVFPRFGTMLQVFPRTFGGEHSYLKKTRSWENISKDGGKTSEFQVCSDNPKKYPSKKVEEDKYFIQLIVYYCLSGTVKKKNKNFIENGILSLNTFYRFETANGDYGFSPTKSVKFPFKAEKVNPVN